MFDKIAPKVIGFLTLALLALLIVWGIAACVHGIAGVFA